MNHLPLKHRYDLFAFMLGIVAALVMAVFAVVLYSGREPAPESRFFPVANAALGERSVVITPTPEPTVEPTPAPQLLQNLVDDFVANQHIDFYIYVKDLNTGESARYRDDFQLPSGSIYKLFVAWDSYQRMRAGQFAFSQPAPGTGLTAGQCVINMVRYSSNPCGETVRLMLGPSQLQANMQADGYVSTDFASYEAAHTSPRDVGLLLDRLYTGGHLHDLDTAEMVQSMNDQLYTFRIPEGLPREPVASGDIDWGSKTGDVYSYMNDAAIVWGENTDYLLVTFTTGGSFGASSTAQRQLSGAIYNHLNNTDYPLPY